jgi:uncharacterized phage protein (TIGR02220 family)
MAEKDKRFYWLKLKSEFMNGEIVDFLMSQKNGANYVVLYQMLALKTMNTNGKLCCEIGEVLIPFDPEKIQRECKWFDIDTIRVAIELYSKLGLVYKNEDGILQITQFEELVGSETYWAKQKRIQKENKNKEIGQSLENFQYPLISNNLISNNNININNIYKEIIDYLNEKAKTKYRQVENNYKHIKARINEGFSLEDLKLVIDKKCKEWIGTEFERYLTPETLFRPSNFEKYLNQNITEKKSSKGANKREYTKEYLESLYTPLDEIEI